MSADMDKDGKSDFIISEYESWESSYLDFDSKSHLRLFPNLGGQKTLFGNELRYSISSFSGLSPTISLLIGDFTDKNGNKSNIAFIQGLQIWRARYEKNLNKDLRIAKISEAGGSIQTEITYSPLKPSIANNGFGNQDDLYYSENKELYPNFEVRSMPLMEVVSQLKITGAGQAKKQDFKYYGLTINNNGYGYFGFKKMARSSFFTDAQPARIWSVIETKPGFLGKAVKEWTYKTDDHSLFHASPTKATINANLLSLTEYIYNNSLELPTPIINQKIIKKITLTKSIKKDFLTNIVNNSTIKYDAFLNPTKTIISNGISIKTTNLLYFNNPIGVDKNYILGRLVQKNERVTAYGDTRTSEQKLVYTNNLLTKSQTKGHNTDYITENNVYNALGNLTKKTISAPGVSTRSSKWEYDATQRFVTKETDAENFSTIYSEFNIFGQPTKILNHLGILSQTIFDNWGKPTQKILTGASTAPQVENLAYIKNTDGTYTLTSTDPATGEEGSKQMDAFGREIKATTKGFATGTKISKRTEYDALNRKTRESETYFDHTTPTKWNTIEYDDFS